MADGSEPSPGDHRGLPENLGAAATRLWPYGHDLWHPNHTTLSKKRYAGV
jgi:hypothetical protein